MLRIFDFIDGLNLDVALMRAETALYVAKEEALNYTPKPEKHSVPKTEDSEASTELSEVKERLDELAEDSEVPEIKVEEVVEDSEVSETTTEETNSEFVDAMLENIFDSFREEALSGIESDKDKELMTKILNDVVEKSNVKEVLVKTLSEVEKSLEEDVDKENAAKGEDTTTSEEPVNSENNETVVTANTTPENPSPTNPVLSVLGNNNPDPTPMPTMNPNGVPMMNPNPMPVMNPNPMPMNPTPTTNPALTVLANNPALRPSLHAPVMPNPFGRPLRPAANPDDVLIDPRLKDLIAGVIYEDGSIGLDMSNLIIKDEDEPKIFNSNNSVRESVNKTTLNDVKNLIADAEKKEMKGKGKRK